MDIKPRFKHSKAGNVLFNLCAKWTAFIVKHKILYYCLACTWGAVMTVIGCLLTIVFGILKLFKCNVIFNRFWWVYGVSIGPDYWGGCNMGLVFFRDKKSSIAVNSHEFGHTFQNCLFGPLFPLMVCIPSAIRYWWQTLRTKKNLTNKPYDSIWFEDAATQCGIYAQEILSRN